MYVMLCYLHSGIHVLQTRNLSYQHMAVSGLERYIIPNLWIKKQLLFNNINKLFHLTANAKYQRSEVKTIYNNDLRHQ